VHRQCLKQWRETSRASGAERHYYRCEVCHFEYKYARMDRAAILAHPWLINSVFALLVLSLCALLGFVPIVQACLAAYDIHFVGVLRMGVHMIDGLMMLGVVSFAVTLAVTRRCPSMDACVLCYICPDSTLAAGAGCGEICGPIVLVLLVVAAVVGLMATVPRALKMLHEVCCTAAGASVQFIENVSTPQKKAKEETASASP